MKNLKYILFCGIAAIILSSCAGVQDNNQGQAGVSQSAPQHKIVADLGGWRAVKQQDDPDGYTRWYVPTYGAEGQEKILINYGKNITTSLNDSMQDVLRGERSLPCNSFDYKVLSQTADSLVFKTELKDCQSGPPALTTIRKVFNAEDGQYSITYSIMPSPSNKNRMNQMQKVISESYLSKI